MSTGTPSDPGLPAAGESRPTTAGERRTTTVVFSDLVGFSGIAEMLDPEQLRHVQDRYFEVARTTLEGHGGTVEKYIGDAVVAVFGMPRVHEDDALRAVRAAIDLQAAVDGLGQQLRAVVPHGLRLRSGVNTGEVVSGPAAEGALVTGDVVNIAARLQALAEPGDVVISASTFRLVRHAVDSEPLGTLAVKGRIGQVEAHRVTNVARDAASVARRLDGPFVGRADELARMRDALDAVASVGSVRAITIVGSPGVGKSRLVHEFLSTARSGTLVLRGRCLPYGDGITWWPLVEIVHAALGVTAVDDAATIRARLAVRIGMAEHGELVERRIASVIGVNDELAPAQEVAWAVRVLLERLAADRPLVVVVDDVHWADPTFLDLLEHVADRLVASPFLLLCIARPELREARHGWMEERPYHELIRLEPMSAGSIAELLDALLGPSAVPPEARSRILDAADGNPLFLEQLLAMLVDDRLLRRDGERWVLDGDLGRLAIPPTIGGLLGARLDRLSAAERATIERASVIGKIFWWGSVAELMPPDDRASVGGHLTTLVRRELIRPDVTGPDATIFPGDEAFRFRHLLVRDAAYALLPKADRLDLHERFATWLTARTNDAPEYAGIVGYHLEQAVLYRRELAIDPAATDRLAARAAAYLGSAGMAAYERSEAQPAVSLLTRAVDLLPAADSDRRPLLFALSFALSLVALSDESAARINELAEVAEAANDERWILRARLRLAKLDHLRGAAGSVERLESVGREVLAASERLDDPGLGSLALRDLGSIAIQRGSISEEDALLVRALDLANRAGDRRQSNIIRLLRVNRAPGGLHVVAVSRATCAAVLADPATGLELRAIALISLGYLDALDDQPERGRRDFAEARRIAEDLGAIVPILSNDLPGAVAFLERWLGELAMAEAEVRAAVAIQRDTQDHWHLSSTAALLAELVVRQPERMDIERLTEAHALVVESRAASVPDDTSGQAIWRMTEALLESAEGRHEIASTLANQAVELMETTEELFWRIDMRLSQADVALAAGAVEEARTSLVAAGELAKRKGSRLFERIARARLAALSGAPAGPT